MTSKRIVVFVEDEGQERLLKALIERVCREEGIHGSVHFLSAKGGAARMIHEVGRLLEDLGRGRVRVPDLLIVGRDANCNGRGPRQKELADATASAPCPTVMAIPDPHVERWFLIDGHAFKKAVGRGCQAPDNKCDKDRYKELLGNAVATAGPPPLFGGIEHAEAIVAAMDLRPGKDDSFDRFIADLRKALRNL